MPPETGDFGTPSDWMRYAEADLHLAKSEHPPLGLYEPLCYHAQQAVEKSLKAVLVHHGVDFPRTHNLQSLIDLLPGEASWPPALTGGATPLAIYSVLSRYPGAAELVLESEYRSAIRVAEQVVEWAKRYLTS